MMRHLISLPLAISALLVVGCPVSEQAVQPTPIFAEAEAEVPLLALVDQVLEDNLSGRKLSTETHGAWQILHGVLAYGDRFTVETPQGTQPAIEYLLAGGPVDGFDPIAGDMLGDPPRRGLAVPMQVGTKIGQGHRDQWLAILSQCDLPIETPIKVDDQTYTIGDWVRQTEYDLARNLELEFSWTLIALTRYRDTDHHWTGRDGVRYSIEDLLYSELSQNMQSSVCGGTHRLIGIAMAVDARRRADEPLTGVWADAQRTLSHHIDLARENQNPDGSYSVAYLHRPGWARDLGETLGTTGHVLEFLALAAPDHVLQEPWVERTVRKLCQTLRQCRNVDMECGVLYHALHGLQEYRSRMQAVAATAGSTAGSTASLPIANAAALSPSR